MSVTNGFEKHIQTGIQAILVGITIWIGSSIVDLRGATIRNEEKAERFREQITDLRNEVAAVRALVTEQQRTDYSSAQTLRQLEERMVRVERERRRRGEDQ